MNDVHKMADALIEASAQVVTEDELLRDEPAGKVDARILEVAAVYAALRAHRS